MIKCKLKKKVWTPLSLSILMAILPIVANAQKDGFFTNWNDLENRDENGIIIGNQTFGQDLSGITNQTFGQDAPIGGGVSILVLSSIGYALIKRRKDNY